MNLNSQPSLVFSDYPLKSMLYCNMLAEMGVNLIETLDWIPDPDDFRMPQVPLVVVDMNLPRDEESSHLDELKIVFPNAQIVFFEEDHKGAFLQHTDGRDVARIGKLMDLAEVRPLLHSMIEACRASLLSSTGLNKKAVNE
ncbi:hypothetical protein [Limnobacter litoralis]|uniref:Response regulator n=1 Tax=Limnobacter litoralis TaxID=481366 RepID=A0ABQ5YRC8_9BURK|nr:hypothetical protein [Limnobacter litoralis]GLR26637.1 hypothetical protein GCM10007875_17270 [Limnobacter litoralis]